MPENLSDWETWPQCHRVSQAIGETITVVLGTGGISGYFCQIIVITGSGGLDDCFVSFACF